MDFYTSANGVSVRGTTIPSGIYKVKAVHDSNQWTLIMKQVAGDGITPPKPHSDFFELAMSVEAAPSQSATPVISLEPIAQTCTLHMKWQLSQASVEFAKLLTLFKSDGRLSRGLNPRGALPAGTGKGR